MKRLLTIQALSILIFCPIFLKARALSEPERVFEVLWKTFDSRYAIFLPKRIDWDALYKVYRPKVTLSTTDDELFEILSNMLGHLNDNHVRLMTADRKKVFSAGILNRIYAEQFSSRDEATRFMRERPVDESYIKGGYQVRLNGRFADDIGYFHFSGFGDVTGDSLPNGWRFSVSYKLFVDQDGFCWEGIGVPPDLMVVNSKEDLAKRKDRVLEFAIDLVNTNALKPRPKPPKYPIEK